MNQFATPGSDFAKEVITKNPQLLVKLAASDITAATTTLTVKGFAFAPADKYRISTGTLLAPQPQISDENTEAYTLKPTWAKVENADFYEIEFDGMFYTTIRETELLFEGLKAETAYSFKVRAVNKEGVSDWAECSATTKQNPLEFAITGMTGETSVANQGNSIRKLFDFEEGEIWHTKYNEKAVPFDLIIDLRSINQIENFIICLVTMPATERC